MEKVREITLKNPNNTREKVLIYRTYNYFHLMQGQEEVIQINSDKELRHYKKSAEIHNLDFTIDTKVIGEDEDNEEEVKNSEPTAPEVKAEDTEPDTEEEVEADKEPAVEETQEEEVQEDISTEEIEETVEEEEIEEPVEDTPESDEEETVEDINDLDVLEEKLEEFDAETLQGLVDKFDITTYGATKKETLINKIIEQADKLPQEFV